MLSLWGRGKSLKEDELITRVLVTLDDGGKIRKIARISSSGVVELDEAAIESFEQAAPFPNPPKGIIEPDGLVRIRWDFILKTESAPRIQFQRAGQPNF
jgi:protein TonB